MAKSINESITIYQLVCIHIILKKKSMRKKFSQAGSSCCSCQPQGRPLFSSLPPLAPEAIFPTALETHPPPQVLLFKRGVAAEGEPSKFTIPHSCTYSRKTSGMSPLVEENQTYKADCTSQILKSRGCYKRCAYRSY